MKNKKEDSSKKGRPKKEKEKLSCSINLKLTEIDFSSVKEKATQLGLTATEYARELTLKGSVKSRFTIEDLDLMRKLSGIANNLNQLAKRANQAGFKGVGNEIMVLLEWIKALFDDC